MVNEDDARFRRALARIGWLMAALALAGTVAAGAWRGWTAAAGFALGAAASWVNYRILKRVADGLGSHERSGMGLAVAAGMRYLLLGGAAYVTLRYTQISLPAALTGLFVPAGAVILELLYELIYAGT